ncbi:MAG: hypothetical protein LBB60_12010 [Desulfovibrio sp.]|nr:hypothetical protein [Desulfovibrio sp.]
MNGQYVGKNSMDNFSDRVTSFIGWYEIDAPLTEYLRLTPYLGWRSLYAHLENPRGESDPGKDNSWVHLASGGLKLNYQKGPFGAGLRAGVNHRVSNKDIPGFVFRAMAPEASQVGFNIYMDRTVADLGTGVSYVFPGYGVLFGGYDAMLGQKTTSHTLSLGFVIPF